MSVRLLVYACVMTIVLPACWCRATDRGPERWCATAEAAHSLDFLKRSREVRHPTDSNIVIRIVAETEEGWIDETTFVRRGLYASKDGGRSWKNVNRRLVFDGAFYIHPLTGQWFACVVDARLRTSKEGLVEITHGHKIVMSDDGARWLDITRGTGHAEYRVSAFYQDPDAPKRVIAVLTPEIGYRGAVMRSVDDQYTSWIRHDLEELQRLFPERYKKSPKPEEGRGIDLSDYPDKPVPK